MALTDQWETIERDLPEGWSDVRLRLRLPEVDAPRAAELLGPLNPSRTGGEIGFFAISGENGPGPEAVRRALVRIDRERLGGTLELVGARAAEAEPEGGRPALAEAWDAAVATLPPDWSDLLVELELDSSDRIMPASVNMVPLNARREGGRPALRFRAARRFGYGAAPEMVRRCLARCDEDGIEGELRILRVLSDTYPVSTQGPVWHVGGRTV